MKHLLPLILILLFISTAKAQTTPGPVEQKMTANICDCISALDYDKITNKQSAEKAFMGCFTNQANLMLDLAEERKIDITDQVAMREMGTEIGKNLMRQNCPGFMKIALAMAEQEETVEELNGVTEGRLKRIETKDFNYFVITDENNKEKSFIWLRQFTGSDDFISNANKYVGKKIRISWQEIEVYVPTAKNYFGLKEVTELQVL